MLIFGVPLTLYCLIAYGVRRVANLREKGFHLGLFLMMFFCGISYSLCGILIFVYISKLAATEDPS